MQAKNEALIKVKAKNKAVMALVISKEKVVTWKETVLLAREKNIMAKEKALGMVRVASAGDIIEVESNKEDEIEVVVNVEDDVMQLVEKEDGYIEVALDGKMG